MKNKKMHKISGALSYVLILSLLFSGFTPAETVNKEPPVINDELMFPDIVDAAEAKENDYVSRVKAAEKDLYTFVFANSDGTNTMRVYSHPVKYIADDGSVRDISLDIKAKKGGGFVTADHEITTTFESKLTEGISLGYNDVEITLVPTLGLGTAPTAKLSSDGKAVTYQMNEDTFFVYQLTYAGFKEDIVVEKYTGQTEYEFSLFTSGLTLCEEYGSYYLADVEGNVRATLGDIIVFTADERNNARGGLSYEVVRANQEYRLTIHLDADYLADEKTMYPIRIDPTIEINYDNSGAGAIEDVSIIQNATFNGTSGSLFVGRFPATSLTRILMRFPNLSLNELEPEQVTAATVELRDLMCQDDEDITVECCIYDISAPAWSEGGTTTWSSVGTNYLGSVLDSHLVSYGQGNVDDHRYSFNILAAAKAWADGTQSPAKGLVFKANSAFENQSGTNVDVWRKTFASYNRTEYQPSLSISYIDFAADAESISADILTPITVPSGGTKMAFKFVPSTTGFYTFESSNIVSGDPMAWLYNYKFETLYSSDDTYDTCDLNFRLTYHLIAGYKYYFVAGCSSYSPGSYNVKITKTATPSYITANSISWGDSKSVSNPYEDSFTAFKFTPSVTGEYLLYTIGSSGDPKLWIYNSNLNLTVVVDDGAGNNNSRLMFEFTEGNTYYIAAGHFGSNFGSYNLILAKNTNIATDIYYLRNVGTRQYVDIHGPAPQELVHQWAVHTGLQEKWKIQKSDGYFSIQSEYGNRHYIGITATTTEPNTVKLYSTMSDLTLWRIYELSDGVFVLEPKKAEGKLLYIPNGSMGTELQLTNMGSDVIQKNHWNVLNNVLSYVNYYDSTFASDSTLRTCISAANTFSDFVYSKYFDVGMYMDGDASQYATIVDDCSMSINNECTTETCGEKCYSNHHKNRAAVSRQLFNDSREDQHLYVLWTNRASGTYCDSKDGRHTAVENVLACVCNRWPVIHFLWIYGSNTDMREACAAICLVHETAHTLNMSDVYGNVGHDQIGTTCVMEVFDPSTAVEYYQDILNGLAQPFCSTCEQTMSQLLSDIAIEGNID